MENFIDLKMVRILSKLKSARKNPPPCTFPPSMQFQQDLLVKSEAKFENDEQNEPSNFITTHISHKNTSHHILPFYEILMT